jgi:hypothetical protein
LEGRVLGRSEAYAGKWRQLDVEATRHRRPKLLLPRIHQVVDHFRLHFRRLLEGFREASTTSLGQPMAVAAVAILSKIVWL